MDLMVQKRVIFGKNFSVLRKQGLVAAELYGKKIDNIHLTVSAKDLNRVFKESGENTLVNLVIDSEKRPALIYKLSRDPVTDKLLSVDFYQVRMDEMLRAKVPVEFINESPAVKSGGILVKTIQEIEVEALPGAIQSLSVDLSGLVNIGQSFYVKDFPLEDLSKKGVKIFLEPGTVVATIKAPITEEQEQAMTATTPAIESIKVEAEERKIEREQKKKEEAPTA